jgi:hypothetical protein
MLLQRHSLRSELGLVVCGPLALAVLEIFHPHPHDLMNLDVRLWLFIHYAQIPLFPLSALVVARLVRGADDLAAAICRAAMFVFAVSFTAFDTAAGVVTGILVTAAHQSGNPDAWRPAVDTVWTHPIVGGSPLGQPPLLAVLGSIALSLGAVAAAVSLKRAGRSWAPVLLLAIASFGISVFRSHSWPGGPLTFGGIGIAAVWLLWERGANAAAASPRSA